MIRIGGAHVALRKSSSHQQNTVRETHSHTKIFQAALPSFSSAKKAGGGGGTRTLRNLNSKFPSV